MVPDFIWAIDPVMTSKLFLHIRDFVAKLFEETYNSTYNEVAKVQLLMVNEVNLI